MHQNYTNQLKNHYNNQMLRVQAKFQELLNNSSND